MDFAPGKMNSYISNIDFSLNFEDSKSSVKVHVGETILYDGTTAKFTKKTGEDISGRTSSLRSAIASHWITPSDDSENIGPLNVKVDRVRGSSQPSTLTKTSPVTNGMDGVPLQDSQYHAKAGGNFDVKVAEERRTSKVITEEDRTVKKTQKMGVTGDQTPVGGTTVTSSTSIGQGVRAHSTKVVSSEHYNADSSIPITMKNKNVSTPQQQDKKTFTVDGSMGGLSDDPMTAPTLTELQKKAHPVVQAAESQDAVVVKKVGSRPKMTVQEVDGVTLKNSVGSGEREIDTSAKVGSKKIDAEPKVTVSAGSTPVADLSGVNTQTQADQASEPVKPVLKKGQESYLDKMPDDWKTMHWVKKEQFIKQITDKEFVKFILTVETLKAVQDACRKRLVEIEKANIKK